MSSTRLKINKNPLKDLQERANSGEAFAQVMLGFLLEHGHCMTPNKEAAKEWYECSAKAGCSPGMYALASLLWDDEPDKALHWLNEAANANYPPAQFLLGRAYLEGKITSYRKRLGVRWIRKAADQDFVTALRDLGTMYEEGILVKTNRKLAMDCYRRAAEQGDGASASRLGHLLIQKGNEDQVDEALNWIWAAAQKDYAPASSYLSQMFRFGLHNAEKNRKLAEFFQHRTGFHSSREP